MLESVATVGVAGSCRDGADAAHSDERCFRTDPVGVITRSDKHLSCRVETDAEAFKHLRCCCLGERLEVAAVHLDLFVEIKPPVASDDNVMCIATSGLVMSPSLLRAAHAVTSL